MEAICACSITRTCCICEEPAYFWHEDHLFCADCFRAIREVAENRTIILTIPGEVSLEKLAEEEHNAHDVEMDTGE